MDTSLPKFHNIQLQRHSLSYIPDFFLCFCFKGEPLVHKNSKIPVQKHIPVHKFINSKKFINTACFSSEYFIIHYCTAPLQQQDTCYIRSCFMLLVFLAMLSRLLLMLFAGLSSILLFFLLFLLFSLGGLISSSSFSSPCGTSSICMRAGLFSLFNKPKVNDENNFKTST
jgi:hypothetical protein